MKKTSVRISVCRETLVSLVPKDVASVVAGISAVCTHGVICDTHAC